MSFITGYRLFYPIIVDDPNITSYTGPQLAQYTEADLQMRYINAIATPGGYNWCQETLSSNTGRRRIRGRYGSSYLNWFNSSDVTTSRGWRAVLELVM